jgi:hypothetical protein
MAYLRSSGRPVDGQVDVCQMRTAIIDLAAFCNQFGFDRWTTGTSIFSVPTWYLRNLPRLKLQRHSQLRNRNYQNRPYTTLAIAAHVQHLLTIAMPGILQALRSNHKSIALSDDGRRYSSSLDTIPAANSTSYIRLCSMFSLQTSHDEEKILKFAWNRRH